MDPLTLAAIGAGVGLAKSELIDRPREQRQRKSAAEIMRWSPWTGLSAGSIKEADPFGAALQGGLAGGMIGQMGGTGAEAKDAAEAASASAALSPQEQAMTQPFYQQPAYGAAQSMEDPYTLMARQRAMRGY